MGAIFGTIFVKISHNCLKMTVMMIRWVGVIRGCVGANGCIFWDNSQKGLFIPIWPHNDGDDD